MKITQEMVAFAEEYLRGPEWFVRDEDEKRWNEQREKFMAALRAPADAYLNEPNADELYPVRISMRLAEELLAIAIGQVVALRIASGSDAYRDACDRQRNLQDQIAAAKKRSSCGSNDASDKP